MVKVVCHWQATVPHNIIPCSQQKHQRRWYKFEQDEIGLFFAA